MFRLFFPGQETPDWLYEISIEEGADYSFRFQQFSVVWNKGGEYYIRPLFFGNPNFLYFDGKECKGEIIVRFVKQANVDSKPIISFFDTVCFSLMVFGLYVFA